MSEANGRLSENGKIWNAFVDRMVGDPPGPSSPEHGLYHVFWYMSEVNNGGHLQYFHNRGTDFVPETVTALRELGCKDLAVVLSEAVEAWEVAERRPAQTPEEYVETALEGEFASFDSTFQELEPEFMERLEAVIQKNAR